MSSGEQNIAAGCISGDPHNPRFEMSDMEWDLVPSSLGKALRAFWGRYRLPLLVTESGIADEEQPDERRVRYLSGCLRAVADAIDDGVEVRGYTYWSLLDNFEWAEGFRPRFGLYRIDYTVCSPQPSSLPTLPFLPHGARARHALPLAPSHGFGLRCVAGHESSGDWRPAPLQGCDQQAQESADWRHRPDQRSGVGCCPD